MFTYFIRRSQVYFRQFLDFSNISGSRIFQHPPVLDENVQKQLIYLNSILPLHKAIIHSNATCTYEKTKRVLRPFQRDSQHSLCNHYLIAFASVFSKATISGLLSIFIICSGLNIISSLDVSTAPAFAVFSALETVLGVEPFPP